jgi:hypothetical protein
VCQGGAVDVPNGELRDDMSWRRDAERGCEGYAYGGLGGVDRGVDRGVRVRGFLIVHTYIHTYIHPYIPNPYLQYYIMIPF